ncbi:MAG: hypothetical protein PHT07_10170 [Paludibacter sp.]|nr:hypothetical protein [Paludibacter sp.]
MPFTSKIHEAGDILKHFCEENGAQFLWDFGGLDHGFLDGGCKLLADVIMSIKESVLTDKNIFFVGRKSKNGERAIVDHVAVGFWLENLWMYLDANGLQTESELIENLRDELSLSERDKDIVVDFFDEHNESFMESVIESGFALYEELDLVRQELVKMLGDIGFIDTLKTIDKPKEKMNYFKQSAQGRHISPHQTIRRSV